MIVLDASAAVDFVLRRPERGAWVASELLAGGALHSPHLIDVEVASALRRFVLTTQVTVDRATAALDVFAMLAITRHAPRTLLSRVWSLREVLSSYDATYVALAEAIGAPLVTTDDRLARTRGHRAEIRTYGAV